jgi:hypothetical protein
VAFLLYLGFDLYFGFAFQMLFGLFCIFIGFGCFWTDLGEYWGALGFLRFWVLWVLHAGFRVGPYGFV